MIDLKCLILCVPLLFVPQITLNVAQISCGQHMSRSARGVRVMYINFGSYVLSVKQKLLRYILLSSIIERYGRLENEPQKGY